METIILGGRLGIADLERMSNGLVNRHEVLQTYALTLYLSIGISSFGPGSE